LGVVEEASRPRTGAPEVVPVTTTTTTNMVELKLNTFID
jgi:hypothetical protein